MNMRSILLLVLMTMASTVAAEEPSSLFDGKTFDGWEGNLKMFRIEDGCIVGGRSDKRTPHNEFLCTKREFEDFELRLKVKVNPPRINAGIQLRSRRIPNHHEVIGYQADVGGKWWGKLYDESRRRRILAALPDKELAEIVKPNDWNEYVIRCEGPKLQFWLNGQKTVDYEEKNAKIAKRGIIGLQIHGGPPGEAWYKDITIVELKKSE